MSLASIADAWARSDDRDTSRRINRRRYMATRRSLRRMTDRPSHSLWWTALRAGAR
jgi:hypothetical protein